MRIPRYHHLRVVVLFAVIVALALLVAVGGEPKFWAEVDWLDVVGEGAVAAMAFVWIWLVLASRPAGRVTNLLYAGGTAYFAATWLDLCDEFFAFEGAGQWVGSLESIPAPIGMVLLTLGLVGWHREQRTVNSQLKRRERFFREHRLVDYLTKLYSADYLLPQLQRELRLHQARQAPLALLVIDLDDFAGYNRLHGDAAGDRLLREVSECLLAQLRLDDLLCRYAGDRFVALLPTTSTAEAEALALHLTQQIALLGRQPLASTVVAVSADNDSAASLLQRGQRLLDERRQRQRWAARKAG
ncbi:MAG: GGDEF domain-containing protein [Gammaproteobacteria bacterium]|nr:GGDEF domain-containing protein [Gammaproteobacteria bacterium]